MRHFIAVTLFVGWGVMTTLASHDAPPRVYETYDGPPPISATEPPQDTDNPIFPGSPAPDSLIVYGG